MVQQLLSAKWLKEQNEPMMSTNTGAKPWYVSAWLPVNKWLPKADVVIPNVTKPIGSIEWVNAPSQVQALSSQAKSNPALQKDYTKSFSQPATQQPQQEQIKVEVEKGKSFPQITMEQENALKTRLKEKMPNATPEERFAEAQRIVAKFAPQEQIKTTESIADYAMLWLQPKQAIWDTTRLKEWAGWLLESVVWLPRFLYNLKQSGQNAVRNKLAEVFWAESLQVSPEYGKIPETSEMLWVDKESELYKLWETVGTLAQIPLWAWWATAGVKWAMQLEKQAATNAIKTAVENLWDEWGAAILKSKPIKDFWNAIKPQLTPSEYELAKVNGKTSIIDWVETLLPSKWDTSIIKTAVDIGIDATDRPVNNIDKVFKNIVSEAEWLKQYLIENWKPFNVKTIQSKLNNIEMPRGIRTIEDGKGIFKDLKDAFMETVNNLPRKTDAELLEARKKFYKMVKDEFGNIYTNERLTPLKKSVDEIADTINTYISDRYPDNIVKDSLKKQSNLFRLKEYIGSQKTKEWENAVAAWMRANPKAARYLQNAGLIIWWWVLWKIGLDLFTE